MTRRACSLLCWLLVATLGACGGDAGTADAGGSPDAGPGPTDAGMDADAVDAGAIDAARDDAGAVVDGGPTSCDGTSATDLLARTCADENVAQVVALVTNPRAVGLVSVAVAPSAVTGSGEVTLVATAPWDLGDARLPVGLFRATLADADVRTEVCRSESDVSALSARAAPEPRIPDGTVTLAKVCEADGTLSRYAWSRSDPEAEPEKRAVTQRLRRLGGLAVTTPIAAAYLECATTTTVRTLECRVHQLGPQSIQLADPTHAGFRLFARARSASGETEDDVSASTSATSVPLTLAPGELGPAWQVTLPSTTPAGASVVVTARPRDVGALLDGCPDCVVATLESAAVTVP